VVIIISDIIKIQWSLIGPLCVVCMLCVVCVLS
jgi:hypothetical protein